jgi:hypothetical protein
MTPSGQSQTADQPARLACLDEWEPYAQLCRRQKAVQRRWYVIAILPFTILIFIVFRFFPKAENKPLVVAAVALSLTWGVLVCVYGIALIIRIRAVRCPGCHCYFGSEDECMSCGFPRHTAGVAL